MERRPERYVEHWIAGNCVFPIDEDCDPPAVAKDVVITEIAVQDPRAGVASQRGISEETLNPPALNGCHSTQVATASQMRIEILKNVVAPGTMNATCGMRRICVTAFNGEQSIPFERDRVDCGKP